MVSPGRHCHYLEEQALPRTRGYAFSDGHERTERRSAPRQPTAILAIIPVSYFMILLGNSIIFTALPNIRTAMHYSATGLAWVQDAYTLVFGGLLLLGARAGDLLGRRRVFIFSVAVFALASLLVGVAPTGWWLIGARALQGIGAAVVAPSSLSLLTASFPPGPPGRRRWPSIGMGCPCMSARYYASDVKVIENSAAPAVRRSCGYGPNCRCWREWK
jgi:hypothetical protein